MLDLPWTEGPLCALDLEGTGAQDRESEAILEIAVVPLVRGLPDMDAAYETLVNPGRPVPRRPWISPGLTDAVLRDAPTPDAVGSELVTRVRGRYLVGHNVEVDWRLLHRRYPHVEPAGLIDTLRLARALKVQGSKALKSLVERYELRERVNTLVPEGRPHRALWDTVAAALVLSALVADASRPFRSLSDLTRIAGLPLSRENATLF